MFFSGVGSESSRGREFIPVELIMELKREQESSPVLVSRGCFLRLC